MLEIDLILKNASYILFSPLNISTQVSHGLSERSVSHSVTTGETGRVLVVSWQGLGGTWQAQSYVADTFRKLLNTGVDFRGIYADSQLFQRYWVLLPGSGQCPFHQAAFF